VRINGQCRILVLLGWVRMYGIACFWIALKSRWRRIVACDVVILRLEDNARELGAEMYLKCGWGGGRRFFRGKRIVRWPWLPTSPPQRPS
jgi:hypothetical protein